MIEVRKAVMIEVPTKKKGSDDRSIGAVRQVLMNIWD
jgi:hypothetical protein